MRATIEGRIGYEEKGENGFGYDPIFYVPELGKTTAELTEAEKSVLDAKLQLLVPGMGASFTYFRQDDKKRAALTPP